MKGRYPVFAMILLAGCFMCAPRAQAASAQIQFTATSEVVEKGKTVTVVCQVTSAEAFVDTSFAIGYDDRYLNFITGGGKVTGGYGTLQVSSTGNTEETYKKTFSLQFEAVKKGTAVVGLDGSATVTNSDGSSFSVSSNDAAVTVTGKREKTPQKKIAEKKTPQKKAGKENRLKSLQAHCLSFSPAFTPDQMEYEVLVDSSTDELYVNFTPLDDKSRVLMEGKEHLQEGKNYVTIRVIAENGDERQYKLNVTKEGTSETPVVERTVQPQPVVTEQPEARKKTSESGGMVVYAVLILMLVVLAALLLFIVVKIVQIVKKRKRKRVDF